MTFDLFVALVLVVVWAALPVSLVLSARNHGDEVGDGGGGDGGGRGSDGEGGGAP